MRKQRVILILKAYFGVQYVFAHIQGTIRVYVYEYAKILNYS